MGFMSISEVASKWDLSNRRVQLLCSQNRIVGACKVGVYGSFPKMRKNLQMLESKVGSIAKPTIRTDKKYEYYWI